MENNQSKKKKPIFKKWWFWVIVILLILIIKAMASGGDTSSNKTTSNSSGNTSTTTKKDDKKYSMDKFNQITMGMTYDQVKKVLGDGTEDSSSGDGDEKTVTYSWKNDDGSNITVEVQGNKVVTKAQAMLQSMDAKVTMDKYNKINNGMTYDQVKAILGEGQLTSQTEMLGTKDEIYEWTNSDGSNMNVTFQDGKVDTKAQFELK